MTTTRSRSTLEKLGMMFIVFLSVALVFIVAMVSRGFIQARSASNQASATFGEFNREVCDGSWEASFSKMDSAYRAKTNLVAFRANLLGGALGTPHIDGCAGTISHVKRLQGGQGWIVEISQYLTFQGRTVQNRCSLKSSERGWVVTDCTNVARGNNEK